MEKVSALASTESVSPLSVNIWGVSRTMLRELGSQPQGDGSMLGFRGTGVSRATPAGAWGVGSLGGALGGSQGDSRPNSGPSVFKGCTLTLGTIGPALVFASVCAFGGPVPTCLGHIVYTHTPDEYSV